MTKTPGSNTSVLRKARKIAVLIIGGGMLLAGIALLVLPGPAFLVIPAGFGILATEFQWARRWARVTIQFLRKATSKEGLKALLHDNGLSAVMFLLFLLFLCGQVVAGYQSNHAERRLKGEPTPSLRDYVFSGHCVEATFENWESEFLQMWALVTLTVFLRQKGAADSKEVDEEARRGESTPREDSPWPVRRGGWVRRIYEHSLSLALVILFGVSFLLHAVGGTEEYNEEMAQYGVAPVSPPQYMATSRFWFESFQNWQSEFFSVGVLLVLSIFLRQKGSPESKPVNAPHRETG